MDNKDRDRFKSQVNQAGPQVPAMSKPCWLWEGAFDNQGYPRFWYAGVSGYANRARYMMDGVPIGPDDHVVTLCQNKSCVRPEHHVLGTDLDARQMGTGGAMGLGDQYLMRMMYGDGEITVDHIVLSYGISHHVAEAVLYEGGLIEAKSSCPIAASS